MKYEHNNRAPLLSVVIPCYNHAESLAKTLESLAGQSWRRMQILVVDDASEEPCEATVESFRRNGLPVTLLRMPQRSFTLKARLRGMTEAQGDYLAFVDADDVLNGPDVLENILQTAISAQADLTHFYTVTEDEFDMQWLRQPALPFARELEGKEIFSEWIKAEIPAHSVWCKIYARDLYTKVLALPHPHTLYYHEDFYLTTHFMFFARKYARCAIKGYLYKPPSPSDLDKLLKRQADAWLLHATLPETLASWGVPQELICRFKEYLRGMVVLSSGRVCRRLAGDFDGSLRLPAPSLNRAATYMGARDFCSALLTSSGSNAGKMAKIHIFF